MKFRSLNKKAKYNSISKNTDSNPKHKVTKITKQIKKIIKHKNG